MSTCCFIAFLAWEIINERSFALLVLCCQHAKTLKVVRGDDCHSWCHTTQTAVAQAAVPTEQPDCHQLEWVPWILHFYSCLCHWRGLIIGMFWGRSRESAWRFVLLYFHYLQCNVCKPEHIRAWLLQFSCNPTANPASSPPPALQTSERNLSFCHTAVSWQVFLPPPPPPPLILSLLPLPLDRPSFSGTKPCWAQ